MIKNRGQRGFTLLEVMIATTIMAVAFSAILTSESGSVFLTIKTKEINTATWLAHNVLEESEHLFEGKEFSALPKETKEKFKPPFDRFTWKRELKEVSFPDLVQPEKSGEGIPESTRLLAQAMTKYLNKSLRELVVTISWTKPGRLAKGVDSPEQKVSVSTYLVDLEANFDMPL